MSTRLKQVLIVSVGAVAAVVMIVLGLWQMQVFVDKGNRSVEDRAAQPAVPLMDHVATDGAVGDIYGKQVTFTGDYLPDQTILIPTGEGVRVLTAVRLSDGRVLPVVRGLGGAQEQFAAPPAGTVNETGLFLPGEGDPDGVVPDGTLRSVRMPLLAQQWPQQLIPGFVTLTAEESGAQGMRHAPVSLPSGEGSARNSGYALQWWVFAAFALGMAIKLAHSLGVRQRTLEEGVTLPHDDEVAVDATTTKEQNL